MEKEIGEDGWFSCCTDMHNTWNTRTAGTVVLTADKTPAAAAC